MAKLLSALFFAAALVFGLGTGSSSTYACNEQTAQAEDATGLIQLAMDESEDSADEASPDDGDADNGDAADE